MLTKGNMRSTPVRGYYTFSYLWYQLVCDYNTAAKSVGFCKRQYLLISLLLVSLKCGLHIIYTKSMLDPEINHFYHQESGTLMLLNSRNTLFLSLKRRHIEDYLK